MKNIFKILWTRFVTLIILIQKKYIFRKLFFNDSEFRKIIEDCIEENKEEYKLWFWRYIIFPISLALFTMIVLIGYSKKYEWDFLGENLFSGRLTLISIGVLFGSSMYLNKKKNVDDKLLDENSKKLKDRLQLYYGILITFSSIMYILQSLKMNFDMPFLIFGIILICLLFFLSIFNSAFIHIIRDDLFQNAFLSSVNRDKEDSNKIIEEIQL